MSSGSIDARTHLVWHIQPGDVAAAHLHESGGTELRKAEGTGRVAVLYAYSIEVPAKALTWLDYCEGEDRRLLREATNGNRFDQWFGRNREADIWTLATAWHFYRGWVTGRNVPDFRTCMAKRFYPRPFLDQLLASSHGWLLWDFQVELICHAVLKRKHFARFVADEWCRGRWSDSCGTVPDNAPLPDGDRLPETLADRSWRERHGPLMYFGAPDLHLAYALQTLR
jgi:hypothetical protein